MQPLLAKVAPAKEISHLEPLERSADHCRRILGRKFTTADTCCSERTAGIQIRSLLALTMAAANPPRRSNRARDHGGRRSALGSGGLVEGNYDGQSHAAAGIQISPGFGGAQVGVGRPRPITGGGRAWRRPERLLRKLVRHLGRRREATAAVAALFLKAYYY